MVRKSIIDSLQLMETEVLKAYNLKFKSRSYQVGLVAPQKTPQIHLNDEVLDKRAPPEKTSFYSGFKRLISRFLFKE